MIRKQIYLTEDMNRTLSQLAESRGVPQAEIIREVLARYLDSAQSQEAIWDRLKHRMLDSHYADLQWNRSELYEYQLNRKEKAPDE